MTEQVTLAVDERTEAVTINVINGVNGTNGTNGDSAYVYVAYASDNSGSDFTMTPSSTLDYVAILNTTTEITSPVASDFAGLWILRNNPTFKIVIDFAYNAAAQYFFAPCNMQIDSTENNNSATLTITDDSAAYILGATIQKYSKVEVTPSTTCVVILTCTEL